MYIYIIKIQKDSDVNLAVLKNIIFYNANINNNSSITLFVPAARNLGNCLCGINYQIPATPENFWVLI